MTLYALVQNNLVADLCSPPDGHSISDLDFLTDAQKAAAVAVPPGSNVARHWTCDNGVFSPPPGTPAPVQTPLKQSQAALAAGLTITSAGHPALNGSYACDVLAQADIIAIETSLAAGKGFPGGVTSLDYPDRSGTPHAFDPDSFARFAAAIRRFVYGCRAFSSGAASTLPPASVALD